MLSPLAALRHRRQRDEDGVVVILFAVLALMLMLMAAMVVDLGLARDTRRQSQNASDASALAGANVLYPTSGACTLDTAPATPPCFRDAIAAAKSYALTNFGVSATAWSTCTDPAHLYSVPGDTPCISFSDDTLGTSKPSAPTKLRVVMPTRRVPVSLGALAGVSDIPITSTARAALTPGSARSCGLCLIGSGVSDLGNGDVTVTGGSVHSNGTIDPGANGHMTAGPAPNTISTVGTCPGNCNPVAQTGVAPIADPYENILTLPPNLTGLAPKAVSPCTGGPGIYPALELPNSMCNLSPGLYVLTGTWSMKNNSVLRGIDGVTLYGTCGTPAAPAVCGAGQAGGSLDTKNGETQLVAPSTAADPLKGYALIYDRENIAGLNIQGNGNSYVTGAIYAPKALLEFPGNSCVTVTNGPIIVRQLYGNGNTGCVNLSSVIGASIPAPPAGASLDQ